MIILFFLNANLAKKIEFFFELRFMGNEIFGKMRILWENMNFSGEMLVLFKNSKFVEKCEFDLKMRFFRINRIFENANFILWKNVNLIILCGKTKRFITSVRSKIFQKFRLCYAPMLDLLI